VNKPDYLKVSSIIHLHLEEEIQQYSEILSNFYQIEEEKSLAILINFIGLIMLRDKIMLKKEDQDYEPREYQRN
jgi:hypothetical protein